MYMDRPLKELWQDSKQPLQNDLDHFNNCDGCSRCDHILEYYGGCCVCDQLISKWFMRYDHPAGNYYCEDCINEMPEKNGSEYKICGSCGVRQIHIIMHMNHPNFDAYWTCNKCVKESVIYNRFEILDL